MVDFKTALEALKTGKITQKRLVAQLRTLLDGAPGLAPRLAIILELAQEAGDLTQKQYRTIKRLIASYSAASAQGGDVDPEATMVTHAGQTKTASVDESTVLAYTAASAMEKANETADITERVSKEGVHQQGLHRPDTDRIGDALTERETITENPLSEDKTETSRQDAGSSTGTLDPATGFSSGIDISLEGSMPVPDRSMESITGWEDQSGDLAGDYDEGSIIKQRFKLEKVLGVGGMGKVYRALDLLKYEARDKKPYVAVKLLNESFKDHPEAFISLQRESSRQQRLAHPNIATIYDFDRVGGRGTPVYITMELMEGMELKEHIKKNVRPKNGMPFADAYAIIRQLGAGLTYAHERGLVHSDFKPGNAFLCHDGTVKTLDFGIARAVKNPVTGETEKTLFDPGKLGALTPAYASLEMLEGAEPDTRDDTYALGCTAYELLTGKHPFNKCPANKAAQRGMAPPHVKFLNKKQNRALQRAVAFHRRDRSPTVAHFIDELAGKATFHRSPWFIAAMVLLVIGLVLINPTLNYQHQQKLERLITDINQGGDKETMYGYLNAIRLLDQVQDRDFVSDGARNTLQDYFSKRINRLIDTPNARGEYNFAQAEQVLREVAEFYPESLFLKEKETEVAFRREQFIADQNELFIEALRDTSKIGNIGSILDRIRRVAPNHTLLSDLRPGVVCSKLAKDAYRSKRFVDAASYVQIGLNIVPDNQYLLDLKRNIDAAIEAAKREQFLDQALPGLTELSDYLSVYEVIEALNGLDPDSQTLRDLSGSIAPLVRREMDRVLQGGDRQAAEDAAQYYSALFNTLGFTEEILRLRLAHLSPEKQQRSADDIIARSARSVESALQEPRLTEWAWESALLMNIQEMDALVKDFPQHAGAVQSLRDRIVALYLEDARLLLGERRTDRAENLVTRAMRFSTPDAPDILKTQAMITSAHDKEERRIRVSGNKGDLLTLTKGDRINEAMQKYRDLQQDLPIDDIYLTTTATTMLAESFNRLARRNAETGNYRKALDMARRGYELQPTNDLLKNIGNEYEAEVNIAEILEVLGDDTVIVLPSDLRVKVEQIRSFAAAGRAAEFTKRAVELLTTKIDRLRSRNETAASVIARTGAELFPSSMALNQLEDTLKLQPWEQFIESRNLLAEGSLTKAKALQEAARSKYNGHPQYEIFAKNLERKEKEAENVYKLYQQDKIEAGEDYIRLSTIKNLLTRAQQLWSDNTTYSEELKVLDELIAKNRPKPKPRVRVAEVDISEIARNAMSTTEWQPMVSESDCTARLAGYGRRAKAVCFDMLHRSARGPLMIVVPDDDSSSKGKSFAIGKYEVSIGDWSKYCLLSGSCTPIDDQDKNAPLIGVSLAEARQYTSWLSERTGKTYRLPSKQEWEYAAQSGGEQPRKDFNCRVALGDKVIKGTGTVSVKSGRSNAWGVKNYVGNVQEWVMGPGQSTLVRGGAYIDAHAKCGIGLERAHNGEADEVTGFRVLREEVGTS